MLAKHIGATSRANGAWYGRGNAVVAAQGHLLELATADDYIGNGKWKIEDLPILPNKWDLRVKNDKRAQESFEAIGILLKQAEHVILATDPDDEGELIGRDILDAHEYKGKVSRLWVSALNTEGLRLALANLQPLSATNGNYHAASIRRKLDWLYGINLSRAFSVAFKKPTHIGRIKSQLLHALVQRDREIETFKPVTYHSVCAKTTDGDLLQYVSGSDAPALLGTNVIAKLQSLAGAKGVVSSTIEDHIEVAPPRPYSFSALLFDAATVGICLADGVTATQALYEAGAISYPRTGSRSLPSPDNKGFAAHSCIVLTGALPGNATDYMARIFNLVRQNLKMHSSGAVTIGRRTELVDVGGNGFKLQQQWIEPGKEGFVGALESNHPLYDKYKRISRRPPKARKQGAKLTVSDVQANKLVTVEPEPFDEASMLRWMSGQGIGTEATRAGAINSLESNGMAVVITQTDDFGKELRAPLVLKSTGWAKFLVRSLPPAILGSDMSMRVKAAQDAAKRGESDTDHHLLDATKWLLRVIPVG